MLSLLKVIILRKQFCAYSYYFKESLKLLETILSWFAA